MAAWRIERFCIPSPLLMAGAVLGVTGSHRQDGSRYSCHNSSKVIPLRLSSI
jgi:hypothetical protein